MRSKARSRTATAETRCPRESSSSPVVCKSVGEHEAARAVLEDLRRALQCLQIAMRQPAYVLENADDRGDVGVTLREVFRDLQGLGC